MRKRSRAATVGASLSLLGCAAFAMPPHGTAAAPARTFATLASTQAAPGCADFLGQMDRKPPHVRYVGCIFLPDRQGKPLRATYRVDGPFAAAAEAYLVKAGALNRLKRSCCQWDSPAHQFKDAKGEEYSITMVSDETLAATRAEWSKIPVFEITVELLTEEI